MAPRTSADERLGPVGAVVERTQNWLRSLEFWKRVGTIYGGYKIAQVRAAMRRAKGESVESIREDLWVPHHTWAGAEMYALAVDLRGFYLKAGQFIGARTDFVPEPICRQLAVLHDSVPPMPPTETRRVLEERLGVDRLEDVFEWIDLENPLGSASIAQVHKAKLASGQPDTQANTQRAPRQRQLQATHVVAAGEDLWTVANEHGLSASSLKAANQRALTGVAIDLPLPQGMELDLPGGQGERVSAPVAAADAMASRDAPKGGLVAVKVQYPSALPLMSLDLKNLRGLAAFLSQTELQFDLVSAVDELDRQIRLEFDFTREARVMDAVAGHLRGISKRVVIPRSIPGLVQPEVMVMEYIDGRPLPTLADRLSSLSERQRKIACRRILSRVSEAYGKMILEEGLFQADGHPGNMLVMPRGRVALIDYGQSKQLASRDRVGLAKLVLALADGTEAEVSDALWKLGVSTETDDASVRCEIASNMFDTIGRVDPFSPDSPMKRAGSIDEFPPDLFFVLRVTQLLRGMSNGMGIEDFSCIQQWKGMAARAVAAEREGSASARGRPRVRRLMATLAEYAAPLIPERHQDGHAGI